MQLLRSTMRWHAKLKRYAHGATGVEPPDWLAPCPTFFLKTMNPTTRTFRGNACNLCGYASAWDEEQACPYPRGTK